MKGYDFMFFCKSSSSKSFPNKLKILKIVLFGFFLAWFFADSPTKISLSLNETYDGVFDCPISFGIISVCPFFQMAAKEYDLPISIPNVELSSIYI